VIPLLSVCLCVLPNIFFVCGPCHIKGNWAINSSQNFLFTIELNMKWLGRAIPQVVSRWLPTAAVRDRSWVWQIEICGGQSGAGEGFLRVLRFTLPVFIPSNSPSS
jgi:hypothetical protein